MSCSNDRMSTLRSGTRHSDYHGAIGGVATNRYRGARGPGNDRSKTDRRGTPTLRSDRAIATGRGGELIRSRDACSGKGYGRSTLSIRGIGQHHDLDLMLSDLHLAEVY